ncbi:hypothetical protein ARAM_001128 [Aspergillus rambellii]|uniref:Major facilitator superfamily (MFS) profile domain-containing protein n=1 Tax=Aspergillus rambellii TaxID=308745 RepID=A0A0F8XBV3_9EURO|nr:hypothetical protein ARAM_001128 [Aspergillus rambellii]
MSREHTANSFASFGSDFDIENEAIASTREFENSPRLPDMKGVSRKQHVEQEDDEPDYVFNTSTFEQYLPHFSPVGTSEEEGDNDMDDDEISIEAGRGQSKPPRRLDDSRNSYMSLENSVRSSSPAVRLDYPTSNTPQKSAMRNPSRRAVSENLRKDAQLRHASLAHKENMDPILSKPSRKEQRRTLSELHAKVRDSYDGSLLEDDRPPAVASNNARPTRFGNVNLSHQIADAVERASQEAYAKEIRRTRARAAANATGDTGTQQSFLLPDLPNLSDLVSGVYEDGTPVYTRQTRARTTRFVSPPADATDASVTREHVPLEAIPIPEDEKALFVSLRLLQDKVLELERAKADAEKKLEDMRQENSFLKGGKSRPKDKNNRSNKHYDLDQDNYKKDGFLHENQKLEATNLALQNKVDLLERKTEIQEAALKKLSKERDMAVSQLGVAYLESQDLKSENESLREELVDLKAQFARLFPAASKEREETLQSGQVTSSDASTVDSQLDTRQSTTKEVTTKSTRSKSKASRREDSKAKVSNQVEKEISRLEKERAEEALFSIELPRLREAAATKKDKISSRSRTVSSQAKKQPNTGKQRVKRVIVEEVEVTQPVESTTEATGNTCKSSATEHDLTLLSFIDEREIAQLRKTLEEERLARKRRQSNPTIDTSANETDHMTRQSALKPAPRKSSLKESRGPVSRPASAMGDLTATSKVPATEADNSTVSVPADRPRRHSDHSVTSVAQRRRRRIVEEMTSAFILPDITLRHPGLPDNLNKLPETTQRALDRATQHSGKNCTVCKRSIPGDACDHTRESIKVPKPVPVSERMPEPSIYNEDPTLRPAQPPAVALATVLKALEDELAHLKIQLVSYQGAYNKLDASLSKRQRKSLGEKIERLLKDIDMKADQIYALYDVLEGQKHSVHEMTEQEMEVTLQSIGIDTGAGMLADMTATTHKSSHKNDTDYDVNGEEEEEEEEELPWEGIESTMESRASSLISVSQVIESLLFIHHRLSSPTEIPLLMGFSQQHDPNLHRTHDVDSRPWHSSSPSANHHHHDYDPDRDDDNDDDDARSVQTAIHDRDSSPRFIGRRLSISDGDNESDIQSDYDDPVEALNEKPVTWASLPKRSQLIILTVARLSEPLAQTSLQAYLFHQLRSFDPSLPDSEISTQAGILQGSFTAAQFLTAVLWGRLADSPWMGRKRVLLIGLLGTCISSLGFGVSKSFAAAMVFRILGGVLNSNVGVMRTMISEIIEEKKYQSRAFLLLPMCFNIGVIIGPIIGGMLANPVKNYPHLFGPGSILGGKDGVWWMQQWPFLLPNLISALFIFTSWMAVFLGLDETHEIAQHRSDWGRNIGRRLVNCIRRRRRHHHYQRLVNQDDNQSLYLGESVGGGSAPSSPTRTRFHQPSQKRLGFRQIWTSNVLLTLLVQFLLAFHTSAFNSMTFIFLPTPRAPEGSHQGFFRFSGGLGLPSSRVGLATAIIGFIGLPLQIFVYPKIQSHLGTLASFRTFLPFSPIAYALMPFLVLIPNHPWLVWPAFTAVVGLQVISRTFALPAAVILVNNCVTDPSILGTIHGVAQSISSGARTLGPFIGGWGLGLGLEYNLIGGIWWALALEALVGWFLLGTIYEGRGIERRKKDLEEDVEEPQEGR